MARYKPSDPRDYLQAMEYINMAKERGIDIEIKKYYPRRSNKQNGYLHFALNYFAHCYGCTQTEAKEIYLKQYANRDLFLVDVTDRRGNRARYFRSTSDLNTAEMSSAIANFVAYAGINGIEIPPPDDELGQRICEREMENTNGYR